MSTVMPVYLSDYTPPSHRIVQTDLVFELEESFTRVTNRLSLERMPTFAGDSLSLMGQGLVLESVRLDGKLLAATDYTCDSEYLRLRVPERCVLEIVTRIEPDKNTALEGLYRSRGLYCTQCEAEGFRRITYYLDRPDAMSVFSTRIIADKSRYPVLLSNGNCVERGDLPGGRHQVCWQDPFKKPAYLFALVAGDLACSRDHFTTASGRVVQLEIYVEAKDLEKCDHAMQSLKRAMRWDEEVYGREYDLDIFMIVAVDDFNMGAMENKGLNIFNTSCVLAHPATTTDAGFARVEAVIAHEYFHNWSGNRVTCRDWFQLSLKEGFTVFRDQMFSADHGDATVKRIEEVSFLRGHQFAEDAGPLAHPVQPPSYLEIANFYTVTVYEKGAEIVRMYHSLLGPEAFRQGTDHYFATQDGCAATIDDFLASMAFVSGRDFSVFKRWYTQAGTPRVRVKTHYDAERKCLQVQLTQYCPSTPEADAAAKLPFLIPLNMALIGSSGPLPLVHSPSATTGPTACLMEFATAEAEWVFYHLDDAPVPVFNRGFSAPIHLDYAYTCDDLVRIARFETDGFARFDALQQLYVTRIFEVLAAIKTGQAPRPDDRLPAVLAALVAQAQALTAPAMTACFCQLPSLDYLTGLQAPTDVLALHQAREAVRLSIALALKAEFKALYDRCAVEQTYAFTPEQVGLRSLKLLALDYWLLAGDADATSAVEQLFYQADNMTEQAGALKLAVHASLACAPRCLEAFYTQWHQEALVVNMWLSIQATAPGPGGLARVQQLMAHPAYDAKNPNKIRSLVGAFCQQNAMNFHAVDGSGYRFLAQQVETLDAINPQIAARQLAPLTRWRLLVPQLGALMQAQLLRLKALPQLSPDLYEVVSKSC